MHILTLDGDDLLNTSFWKNGRMLYTVFTPEGSSQTTLTRSRDHGHVASVNWLGHNFEIMGKTANWDHLKQRVGSSHSKIARQWTWANQRYVVDYRHGDWTAKDARTSKLQAVFTPYCVPRCGDAIPARLHVAGDVDSIDVAFLMLVFIHSELRRKDEQHAANDNRKAASALLSSNGWMTPAGQARFVLRSPQTHSSWGIFPRRAISGNA
ncbi:hypothetical protein FISHEDRAFT_72905 [Fistulina hepatica ATCC 64428]|nr:hypothetical protein FISHEDRAFT_72905 [Fistulina hepatica ATCC 64428]